LLHEDIFALFSLGEKLIFLEALGEAFIPSLGEEYGQRSYPSG